MRKYGSVLIRWLGVMVPVYVLFGFLGVEWNPLEWHGAGRLLYSFIGIIAAYPCIVLEFDP